MPNSPGAYAFYEKITGNSVAEPSTISLFSIDQPTPQVIQTRSYTFTNYLLDEKTVKRLDSRMKFSFLRKPTPQKQILSTSDWPTSFVYLFQPLYSEPHVLRKTHTTFAYQSHWLRLWSFLPVYISNFRSQITYSFVKCDCSNYCFTDSLNSDMSR